MRQLAGMRRPDGEAVGEIIETPIISNFKEVCRCSKLQLDPRRPQGLCGHRVEDRELRYLTRPSGRRWQDCIITQDDCGTSLASRARHRDARHRRRFAGVADPRAAPRARTCAIRDQQGRGQRGTLMEETHVDAIQQAGIQEVKIRSALTANSSTASAASATAAIWPGGTRSKHTARRSASIAAQSIGEPGTQLTMRTFHIAAGADQRAGSFVESNFDGKVTIGTRPSPGTAKAIRRDGSQHGVCDHRWPMAPSVRPPHSVRRARARR